MNERRGRVVTGRQVRATLQYSFTSVTVGITTTFIHALQ